MNANQVQRNLDREAMQFFQSVLCIVIPAFLLGVLLGWNWREQTPRKINVEENVVYRDGELAAFAGLGIEQNPYQHIDQVIVWRRGWTEGTRRKRDDRSIIYDGVR